MSHRTLEEGRSQHVLRLAPAGTCWLLPMFLGSHLFLTFIDAFLAFHINAVREDGLTIT